MLLKLKVVKRIDDFILLKRLCGSYKKYYEKMLRENCLRIMLRQNVTAISATKDGKVQSPS